jgi:hypothetical protein
MIVPALRAMGAVSEPVAVGMQTILSGLDEQQKAQLQEVLTGSRDHYFARCVPLVVALPRNTKVLRTEVLVENGTHHAMEGCGDAEQGKRSSDPAVRAAPARICSAGWSRIETPPRQEGDTWIVVVGSWMKMPRNAEFRVYYEPGQ